LDTPNIEQFSVTTGTVSMMIITLLTVAMLIVVQETQGSSSEYISVPVPVQELLAIGVTSKNYSGMNAIRCASVAGQSGISDPILCVHSTSGQCLLLNISYPAFFNRTYPGSNNYKCYVREAHYHSVGVGKLMTLRLAYHF
jgi:hypothetical protein